MEPDFSGIFHQSSKDPLKGHPPISPDPKKWPEAWHTTYYKSYPRLPKVSLEKGLLTKALGDVLHRRVSRRDFSSRPLTKKELSILLQYSCGISTTFEDEDRWRRTYPSGGARYPVEIYPLVLIPPDDLGPGLYHYNVENHQLDVLWDHQFSKEEIASFFRYPWAREASVVIVMTAVFWRSQDKYGERGYRYILIEAGHIGQNLSLCAGALELKCCALAGTYDQKVEQVLDIDGVTESVIYALAFGK